LGVAAIDGDLQQSRAPEESQGLTGMDIMVSFLEPIDAPAFSFDLPRPISDLGSVFSTGYIRNQITEGISEENPAHHLTAGIDFQDSPLYRSGVFTHQAEVGNQGNNPGWFFSQALLLRTIYFLSFPYICR